MNSSLFNISVFFKKVGSVFATYNWFSDTLDILLLTLVIYFLLKIIKDSRAITLAKGIAFFLVAYLIVIFLDMKASAFIFKKIFDNILVILAVLFAPELRKMLEKIGTSRQFFKPLSIFGRSSDEKTIIYNEQVSRTVNSVCKAARDMSYEKIGALIVFEEATPLGEIISTGTVIDAMITSQMIENIFYPKSPLHDGAAVIRNGRLYAAGCILPLTSRNNYVAKELGTRHRAAIGISEESDAVVLVVSEETGGLSIAKGGRLRRDLSDGEVREILLSELLLETGEDREKKRAQKKQERQEQKELKAREKEKKKAEKETEKEKKEEDKKKKKKEKKEDKTKGGGAE